MSEEITVASVSLLNHLVAADESTLVVFMLCGLAQKGLILTFLPQAVTLLPLMFL